MEEVVNDNVQLSQMLGAINQSLMDIKNRLTVLETKSNVPTTPPAAIYHDKIATHQMSWMDEADNLSAQKVIRDRSNGNVVFREIDSSSSSSDGENNFEPIRIGRRRSSLLDYNGSNKKNNNVQMVRQMPAYEHLKLERFYVREVVKFFVEVDKYQMRYKVEIPIATLVSDEIRSNILAQNPKLTDQKFFILSAKKLLSYIQASLSPRNKVAFALQLERNVNFNISSTFVLEAYNFKIFYESLLVYKKDFMRIFDFLAYKIENIPACNNKKGGLI